MIEGKIELRGKQWDVSIGSDSNNLVVAVIRNGDETYLAGVKYNPLDAPEVALGYAFENMVAAGDITWSELEDIADELDPNRDDALRVYLSPIRLIMMGLDGSGRSVRI